MTTSRRNFLLGAVGAVTTGVLPTPSMSADKKPRIRKNVAKLNLASPEIVTLSKALTQMRSLVNDRRNLRKLAEIHGMVGGNVNTHCKHNSALFLPWHRAYLHCFEQIVISLTGDKEFALPYWDWEHDYTLPSLFAKPPLDNPVRPGDPISGRKLRSDKFTPDQVKARVGPKVIKDIVETPNFSTFAGSLPGDPETYPGHLERTPHEFVHAWVGGDMSVSGCAIDPIFWLHHANIDRIWDLWAREKGHTHPKNDKWLQTSFPEFCDSQGMDFAKPITVEDTLARKWGYSYDGYDDLADMTPSQTVRLKYIRAFEMANRDWLPYAGNIENMASLLKITQNGIEIIQKLAVLLNDEDIRELRVRLAGWGEKAPSGLAFQVYLAFSNDEKNRKQIMLGNSAGFVGLVEATSLFPHRHDDVPHSPIVVLNATAAFRRISLNSDKKADWQGIGVHMVAVDFSGRPWKGDTKDFLPNEVSLDVLVTEL